MAKSLIGQTLGGYQITDQIGKGGMATIYKAFQPSLEREVAIKILPPFYAEQDESFIARFKREAKAIANLQHQNILMVMDTGQDGDYFYIVMEYISAGTLKDLFSERPLSLKEISNLITQMGDALDYAHSKGVVHRDIKPSNILMRRDDWALLTDFGLAKMVGGSMLTQSGMTVGTPAYMSPEQGSGSKIDSRTDIYALGVMLYEMTVGEVPYTAETPMAVVVKHITEPLPMPRAKNPTLPEEVQRIILKALAKNPDDRFQTAGDMAKALAEAANAAPDWSASGISTIINEATPGALPPAVTLVAEDKSETPAAGVQANSPISATQVSVQGQSGPNIWKWVAIAMGVIAVLLVGIFGTIAFMDGQKEQSVVADDATVTQAQPNDESDQQTQRPPDDAPDPGNGPNGRLGAAPLPPPPPDDLLTYAEPWEQAFEFMEARDYGQAQIAFYQALLEEPYYWEEYQAVIEEAYDENGPALAAELLATGLQALPEAADEFDNFIWLGYLRLDAERFERALQAFAYVIEQYPEENEAFYGFYYASIDMGRGKDNLRYLENLAESGVENPALFNVMGFMLSDVGEYDRALEMQHQAVNLDPRDPWLLLDLASVYISVGDYVGAESALATALEMGGEDPSVLESIGWAFMDLDMSDQAAESFSRSVEVAPDNPWGYIGLSFIYLEYDENLEEIPAMMEQAYAHVEDDVWALINIGWVYQDLDNCGEALRYFEEANEMEPGIEEVEIGLRDCGG